MSAPFENALREAVRLLGTLASPLLGALLVAGLVTGVLQGVTRVRDRSLSTVPRIIAVGAIVLACAGWAASRVVAFGTSMFGTAIQAGRRP